MSTLQAARLDVDAEDLDPPRSHRPGRRCFSGLVGVEAAWITNRDRRRAPKGGRYWCNGCDANHISPNTPCSHCGAMGADVLKRDPHA